MSQSTMLTFVLALRSICLASMFMAWLPSRLSQYSANWRLAECGRNSPPIGGRTVPHSHWQRPTRSRGIRVGNSASYLAVGMDTMSGHPVPCYCHGCPFPTPQTNAITPCRGALSRGPQDASHTGLAAKPVRPRLDEFLPRRRTDRLRHLCGLLPRPSRLVGAQRWRGADGGRTGRRV